MFSFGWRLGSRWWGSLRTLRAAGGGLGGGGGSWSWGRKRGDTGCGALDWISCMHELEAPIGFFLQSILFISVMRRIIFNG
jgi:hypothetical protein